LGHTGAEKTAGTRELENTFVYLLLFSSLLSFFLPTTALPPSLSLHPKIIASPPLFYVKKRPHRNEAHDKEGGQESLPSNLLDLVERVVVRLHAGVVGLLEAHDNRVQHGPRLVDGDDLAGVVEPVALGAEDLDLILFVGSGKRKREREKERRGGVSKS
jgi:hypothetical protein